MMDDAAALRIAFQLLHTPLLIRQVRSAPLPHGVYLLLQVAVGDESALARAAASTCRSVESLREASAFFIEQILLAPDADSYRVLGGSSGSDGKDLRRNMTLLLKWLHPDVQRRRECSVFARRVALAWDDLKTPERRAAYDRRRPSCRPKHSRRRKSSSLAKTGAVGHMTAREYILMRALSFLFGGSKR